MSIKLGRVAVGVMCMHNGKTIVCMSGKTVVHQLALVKLFRIGIDTRIMMVHSLLANLAFHLVVTLMAFVVGRSVGWMDGWHCH